MLFEFHCKQNSKQPGSVCATYLISGFQTVTLEPLSIAAPVEDEDTPMQSSPYMSSPPKPEEAQASEPQTQRAITLVNEEHLESTLGTRLVFLISRIADLLSCERDVHDYLLNSCIQLRARRCQGKRHLRLPREAF